ncbi:MAG: hypothetical protein ACPG7F_03790, partial [Aggregatilineales bacterium]
MTIFAQDNNERTYLNTYHQADGNRIVDGAGTFPDVQQIDLPFASVPRWIIANPAAESPGWLITLDNGTVISAIINNNSEVVTAEVETIAADVPLIVDSVRSGLPEDASELSHAVRIDDARVYIANNGDLVLWRGDSE